MAPPRRVSALAALVATTRALQAPFLGLGGSPAAQFGNAPALPVIWAPPVSRPTRRTLRSRVTEFCARGWLREQVARGRLAYENPTIESAAPARCGFAGAEREQDDVVGVKKSCAEVINIKANDVQWLGYQRDERGAKLRLRSLDAELTNLHRRVLTRGRRGSVRATLTLRGDDVDASIWLRNLVDRIATKLLREVVGEEADAGIDFETTITKDRLTGAPRLRLDGATKSNVGFSASFLLRAEDGALTLRSPEVELSGRPTFQMRRAFGGVAVPAAILEDLGKLYLSTVAVDASARSGAAFAVVDAKVSPSDDGAVVVSVVSSDATRAAMQRIARRNAVVLDTEQKPSEWRVNFKSMLDGARKHPLRRTFVVGEGLPWILNPRASTPPVTAFATFTLLSWAFALAAVPDTIVRSFVGFARRIRLAFVRPRRSRARLARGYYPA